MPLMVVTILELDYWNTFEKHDSLLQKSMVLAHAGSQRLCKTRRIQTARVPKYLDLAPSCVSSKIRPRSAPSLVTKVGTPTFVTNDPLTGVDHRPASACLRPAIVRDPKDQYSILASDGGTDGGGNRRKL